VAVNEQDIIQKIRSGSIAGQPTSRNLESDRLEQGATISGAPAATRVESIDSPIEALRAGVVSGARNIAAQNKNFRATIATLRGNDEDAANFLKEGDRLEDQAAIPLAGMESFEEFLNEPTASGFFKQFASATGQFIPSLAASLTEAVIVGGIVAGGTFLSGGTATPGLIAGAGALQTAGRQGLKRIPTNLQRRRPNVTKEQAEELLNKQYKNSLAESKGKELPFTFNPKELEDLNDIYAQLRSQKRNLRFTQGALAGAYSQEQRMGTGIAFSDYVDQDMRSPEDAIKALGQGQVFGAIGLGAEAATAVAIGKRLRQGGQLRKSTGADPFTPDLRPTSTFFGDLGTGVAVTSVAEGIAEGLQEELSIQQKTSIDDTYTKANARVDRLNALFAGFFGGVGVGAGLGAGTGAMNKLREYTNRGVAETDGIRMFKERFAENELGKIMKERASALEAQFAFLANVGSNKDSAFIDIDSKNEANLKKLENLVPNAISVATAKGAFFTTDQVKAQEFQNLVNVYPFNTEIQDQWLAERGLGYSRSRQMGDDMVVGIFDTQTQEFVHYQSTSSTFENDFQKAKAKMQEILGTADPKRYKIISQSLAEHREYRKKGLTDTSTTPFDVVRQAFQETENMGTDQDETINESDRGVQDIEVGANVLDLQEGKATSAVKSELTNYIQNDYKLPINYDDLVFFVKEGKKLATGKIKNKGQARAQVRKADPKVRARLSSIYNDLVKAEQLAGPLQGVDRDYLARVAKKPFEEMSSLLDEIVAAGANVQPQDAISSSMDRLSEEGGDINSIPLVGVTEILKRTNVKTAEAADQAGVRAPVAEADPLVMKRFGSGTVENPYVDPKTGKAFRISKTDPKATPEQVEGLNQYVQNTLKQEFNTQKPFLSKSAVENFERRAKEEESNTEGVGFVRFVDRRDIKALRNASKKGDVFEAPQRPDTDKNRGYVIIRMQPEEKEFQQATRRNISEFRNIREDLVTRVAQAKERTKGGNYQTPIYFKVKDLKAGLSESVPAGNIDISVLLEGITTITRRTGRRDVVELADTSAQRVAALLDAITLLPEQGFRLEYYPNTVKVNTPYTEITGDNIQDIMTSPAGASILKVKLSDDPKIVEQQLVELEQKFGLTNLAYAPGRITTESFAQIETPFLEFQELRSKNSNLEKRSKETAENQALIAPFVQDLEANNISEMSLDELTALKEKVENVIAIRYPAPFVGEGLMREARTRTEVETKAKELFTELSQQDKTYLNFLRPISGVISSIEAQDIRNNPGELRNFDRPLGQPSTTSIAFVDPGGDAVVRDVTSNVPVRYKPNQVFRGTGGTIDTKAKIGTYADDIQTIAQERQTEFLEDSGLFQTDDPTMGTPVDTSAVKMDINDRALFESYQAQDGVEYRGRDKYAELSRLIRNDSTKPTFKNNLKYQNGTAFLLQDVLKQRQDAVSPPPTRAKLPFRKQILTGLTTAARQLGLETNLKVITAEETFNDSQLPASVRNTIDETNFEAKRQELLDNPNAGAMTLQYKHFDIIMMKTGGQVNEGAYYTAYLKELGNSFTFQEIEKSLKVPAVRKKLLEAYNKIRESDNAPATYTDDETGFNNFLADQNAIAIREKLGLDVDGTTYSNLNTPAKAWFKRLAKSQEKLYKKLNPAQRKRFEINETFDEYAEDLQDTLRNPANQEVPYQVKAKIESQIESILGPETFTDKQLRKSLEQTRKILTTKNMPKFIRQIFLTSDTRLRHFGPPGEAVANFLYQEPRSVSATGRAGIMTLKTRRANKMLNDVAKVLGVKDGWFYSSFNAEQKAILEEAADDTIDTKDLTNPQAAQVRDYLTAIYKELNLDKYDVDFRKNFFPRVIAIAEIASDEGKQQKLKELLKQANPTVKDTEINKAVTNLINKNNGDIEFTAQEEIDIGMMKERKPLFKNITNKQLIDAKLVDPPEVSLKKYLDKVSLKYEFEQSGGKREFNRLLGKLKPAEQKEARDIIDSMFGKIPPIQNGWLKTANNIGLVLNVVTLLGLTVIASLQDTAGPVLRARGTAKISDVTDVIKNMIKNPQEAADIAREIGVIGVDAMSTFFVLAGEQDFMNQTSKDVSDVWFRATGLEAYTRFTRVFASGMGAQFLRNHARKAKKGDTTSQLYLKELNVTADEVLAWEKGKADKVTREKVNEGLAQFVDESIVRPNPAQRPTYANDPRYALIWQLKSFFYAYGKTIVFPTIKEAHTGFVNQGAGAGAMPLLMMAGMLLPITMLGLEIRELFKAFLAWVLPGVSPDDPGVDYFKTNNMSTGQYMTEIVDRSGMLGPASLALPVFLESHRYGKPFWVSPLGPTAERVYDGITWDWRAADFVPVYSQLDTRALGR